MRSIAAFALLASLAPGAGTHAADWRYDDSSSGPANWATLSPAFAACSASNQSPVELAGGIEAELPPIGYHYLAGPSELVDTGHTMQLNVGEGSRIDLDGHGFALRQLHFHAPSEHRVEGRSYPLEMHLVHVDAGGGLAVVGVLFEQGAAQPWLDTLAANLPPDPDRPQALSDFDAGALLPEQRDYFRYSGSLTTPPCNEGVRWIVLKQPLSASASQLARVAAAMRHANNRPLQELNARVVLR